MHQCEEQVERFGLRRKPVQRAGEVAVEQQTIRLVKARAQHAAELADISKRAFHTDVHCGSPYDAPGGPPGYDSPRAHARFMKECDYYEILRGKDWPAPSWPSGGRRGSTSAPASLSIPTITTRALPPGPLTCSGRSIPWPSTGPCAHPNGTRGPGTCTRNWALCWPVPTGGDGVLYERSCG